ncbi:conserved hypothetical protein [Desulfosarcina cetonica]|uniref:hypothetical protein n=1 Tax=Desulfosarcina cetonica TaxID=90730 RepID=UPI0006D2C393|nr:hypothetical protein [Desulfosarcina cetonica]VTR70603.1 conserved hypothetical protein [Desulfosarcina cetonica]
MNTNPSKPFFARESVWMALILILLGLRVAQAALPNAEEVYHYREVTGKSVKTAEWRLRKAEGFTLTYTSPTQRHVTTTGPDYATRRWTVTADSGQTDFTAERIGRTIHLHGRFKGQAVDKDLAIDDAPWYQATSLSLRGFIASDDRTRVFWTIRYGTLSVHKIKAIKQGTEPVDPPDGRHARMHIRLTLTGLLAPFWKSDYWFSLPDGIFQTFRGPSGPPGAPMTTICRLGDQENGCLY